MKAVILLAGLGTRLRPLTDNRPKALVEVGGRTLLEITLARLHEFEVREVIVNVHHFARDIDLRLRREFLFDQRHGKNRRQIFRSQRQAGLGIERRVHRLF